MKFFRKNTKAPLQDDLINKTRTAFLWTKILSTPFYVVFTLLPFILYKDLNASLLEITVIIILKPVVSLLAPYWTYSFNQSPKRLVTNLLAANILKFVPFLLIPFSYSIWTFTFATVFYLILGRGVIPAWMEILKLNIPGSSRVRVFAFAQAFDYLGIAIFPLAFGWVLDSYHEAWRFLFPITALIGIISSLFLLRIPRDGMKDLPPPPFKNWKEVLMRPWRESLALIKERPDFAQFQWGFMLGGAGLMILQPAYPVFFTDVLKLSYQEMTIALSCCKGIGFALTSSLWARLFERIDIFRFCSIVTFLAALCPLILFLADLDISFLFISFLAYGFMQAGSELSWHMSGPVFSPDSDSSAFSATNILTQGLRGTVAPLFGTLLCLMFNSQTTFLIGCLFCLLATLQMARSAKQYGFLFDTNQP